jgi:hypothetical protein
MTSTSQPVTDTWWPDTTNVLDAALAAHHAGLCVIPLNGKRPALGGWKQYQKQRPSEQDIRRWAQEGLLRNLGIVCGKVSGNLVVLDFDGPGAYGAFAALFPSLASSFTVATGSGKGKHVYLYVDDLPPTTRALDTPIGHIELRAEGTYVAAPPSIHPVTKARYTVEKPHAILRVADLNELVRWIEAFKPSMGQKRQWRPPRHQPPQDGAINPALIDAIADTLRGRRHKERAGWINCSCIYPERHTNGDRNPSFGFNTKTGYGHCYRCGTILAKDICQALGIDPADHGGLMGKPEIQPSSQPVRVNTPVAPPVPPEPDEPSLSKIELPGWLRTYTTWASQVGNQTPEIFHLGMGIWMAAVAIARRVYTDARWGVRLYPNLYMMFVADTTYYRKTTAYKLGERILTQAIPHLLMPTPGSPERFQDALAGRAPSNFNELPREHQKVVLDATRFAAQRGLFKDEIAGLFGAFKRDYMAGLKDFMLEIYDCADFLAKETQSGLAIIRNAAPSILGVTTPAGLSSAISHADWDNGLLPRFALLTPQPDYKERTALDVPVDPPPSVVSGLKALHDALPMPEKAGEGWQAAEALPMEVESWDDCQAYSNQLRRQCDPRLETPLDDRLKGVYGRMHVQAMKVAMICATLDWLETDRKAAPVVGEKHWQTGKAIAESWRASARRLLEHLDRSGAARSERWVQGRILEAFRKAGAQGCTLRSVYRRLNLKARDARQNAQDLVRTGLLVEISCDGAEGYRVTGGQKAEQT